MTDESWIVPRFRAMEVPYRSEIELYVKSGDKHIMTSLRFEDEVMEPNTHYRPTVVLGRDCAQSLMDALWNAGMRPAESGNKDDQSKHLEDMRIIAFHQLNIPGASR